MEHPNKKIMQVAIDLARKNKVVAAIIVKDGEIISQGINTVNQEQQPFRHAEINAIEMACKKLQTHNLSGCWIYSTYEPCPMCASACVWARIDGIVYGASMKYRNENYTQRILIPCKKVINKGTPKPELYKDYMSEECKKLLDIR